MCHSLILPLKIALELNTSHTVYLNEAKSLYVTVTLLDANHCLGSSSTFDLYLSAIGSVMILFQGYMGSILHTGDFRYTPLMLDNSPALFPGYLKNEASKFSIDIDELILDATHCDPVFQFPARVQVSSCLLVNLNRKRFSTL